MALTKIPAEKAKEANLPDPASFMKFALDTPSGMIEMKKEGYTQYIFMPWKVLGDEGMKICPAGALCFVGEGKPPLYRAFQVTKPHPVRAADSSRRSLQTAATRKAAVPCTLPSVSPPPFPRIRTRARNAAPLPAAHEEKQLCTTPIQRDGQTSITHRI